MHPLMTYCFALAIGLGAGTALAQTASKNVSKADQAFLKETVEGDLAEVNMGKLAQEKAQSQAVKDFGKMLEQDHGEHLQMARSKAQEPGVNAPDEPNAKQKAMHDRLSKLSGDQFDNQFAQAMVADHKKDIRAYEKEAKSKGPLADFAQQTLPTLQKHLETAEAVSRQKQSRR